MSRESYSKWLYPAFLFVVVFLFFARWPIFAGDYDLWYHLAGGRYFFQHHRLPDFSFFSFLEPPRRWVDYYWLFQVFVYRLYNLGGYWALAFFRGLAFLALFALILVWLLKRLGRHYHPYLAATAALLYLMVLLPRYASLRPHVFTYLFIAASLFLVEFPGRSLWLLPLIGVLWANIHGISYPILLLIVASYWPDKRLPKKILLLTACTVLATPHGVNLLSVPFHSGGFAFSIIHELTPLGQQRILSIPVFMLLIAAGAALHLFLRRKLRLSHFLLWVAGIYLAFKSNRLIIEATLLSLPVFLESLHLAGARVVFTSSRLLKTLVWLLLVIAPLKFLDGVSLAFGDPAGYPLSHHKLPEGVVAFLNRENKGGRIFNYPNSAGFLEWALDPSYKIYMDLQVPFLFTNEDLGRAIEAFSSLQAMEAAVNAYQPGFITAPLRLGRFREVIQSLPGYALVCFDDVEALYADTKRYPDLGELSGIDPFSIYESSRAAVEANLPAYTSNLPRLLAIALQGKLANYAAGVVRLHEGSYDKALAHAQIIIDNHPNSYLGYLLKAEALELSGKSTQAKEAYRKGLFLRNRADGR